MSGRWSNVQRLIREAGKNNGRRYLRTTEACLIIMLPEYYPISYQIIWFASRSSAKLVPSPLVDNGALRLISIVHHAVLSAFGISVDIHIIVGGKPPAQLLLVSRAPENCAVQKSAVLKAVGKSADIDGASFSKAVYGELYIPGFGGLACCSKDGSAIQGIDILLAFPEIYFTLYIFRDKMAVDFQIIFIVTKGKAKLFSTPNTLESWKKRPLPDGRKALPRR